MLKPILMILAALSTLWDFRVFTQIYVLQQAGGISRDTKLLGVYTYQVSIGQSDYGVGPRPSLVMIAADVRAHARLPAIDVQAGQHLMKPHRIVLNLTGLLVAAIALFPVYWMVLTSFRRGIDMQSPDPSFIPFPGTLNNYRKVFDRDFFWTATKQQPDRHDDHRLGRPGRRLPRRRRDLAVPFPRPHGRCS